MRKLLLAVFLLTGTLAAQAQQTAEGFLKNAIDKQNSGDNEGAAADCTKALLYDANNANIFNVRALSRFNLGLFELAIDDYTRTIRANPTNALAYNYRGACWYALSKVDKDYKQAKEVSDAIKDFTDAIRLSPKYASAFANRGVAKTKIGRFNEAFEDLTAAINLDPTNATYYNNRAYVRNRIGKYSDVTRFNDAMADCDKALNSTEAKVSAAAYRNKGDAEILSGHYEQGIEDCTKSINLAPDVAKSYNFRGYGYYKMGKYELALKDDNTGADLNEDDLAVVYQYRDDAEAKLAKSGKSAPIAPPVVITPQVIAAVPTKVVNSSPAKTDAVFPSAPAATQQTAAASVKEPVVNQPAMSQTTPVVQPPVVSAQAPVQSQAGANTATAVANTNATPNVSFQWLTPVTDISTLPNGIFSPFDSNEITVKLKVISTSGPLNRQDFHLYKNGVSVDDGNKMTTADIAELKRRENVYYYNYTVKVSVPLDTTTLSFYYKNTPATGENLTVLYHPQDINLHVLSIGTQGQNLRYPMQDAADFATMFEEQKGEHRLFHNVTTENLLGESATAGSMITKISDWVGKQYNERDVLILFISSHGLIDKSNGHLLITGTDYKSINVRGTTMDFQDNVLEPLASLNCKKFIFIDACHSGASMDGGKDVAQDISNEISKIASSGNGITIFSSSNKNEKSWEDESWGNGAFTKAIKEGLQGMKADVDQNGFVTMNELYQYVKFRVGELVQTAGKNDNGSPVTQTPQMNGLRGDVSIYIKK
jgi:tetratricopeptide (TPR) repeat protein